jgi:NAD(P)-dependent dehydrogenase (short-subunit alcohol dehydrogenase family)
MDAIDIDARRVAVVTGASRGLGLALATALAQDGWTLVITARSAAALAEARWPLPGEVTAMPGDVTDPRHRSSVGAAVAELGGAHLLVNNAGILGPSPLPQLADYPLDALRDVIEVNVTAPLALTQLLLPGLRAHGGAIVNVTSDASMEAYAGWGGYGLAKAAIDQASRVLAVEEPSVRVWAVDPGDLRTRMHQEAFPGEDISDRPLPESVVPAFLRLLTDRPPSGRLRLSALGVSV